MKIVLFNPNDAFHLDGLALISGILKHAGHQVTKILVRGSWKLGENAETQDHLDHLLRDADIVMMGVYTVYLHRAIALTKMIRDRHKNLKVIWGGCHCVSSPEECLDYADGVCFSEGDIAVRMFADRFEKGLNWQDTPNMAFKINGKMVINELLPRFGDMDSLPFPDVSIEDHYLLETSLMSMTVEKLKQFSPTWPAGRPILNILTSRGCPFVCAYCNNVRYVQMHGHGKIHSYSVDYTMRMVEHLLSQLNYYEKIGFTDDDFCYRSEKSIKEFAEEYAKRFKLPFGILVTASSVTQTKLDYLFAAGLVGVEIGVQTGSERICKDVYNRRISINKIREVVRMLTLDKKNQEHCELCLLDFMADNPYETRDDMMATYYLLLDFYESFVQKKPRVVAPIYFLSFSPGTPLMEKAVKDGIIHAKDIYRNIYRYERLRPLFQKNYEMFLIILFYYLSTHRKLRYVPRFVLKILGSRPIRALAGRISSEKWADQIARMRSF